MPDADRYNSPGKRWGTTAAVIVSLSVFLVGSAVYFAVRQSGSLALLRISAAQREALQLRSSATERIRLLAGRMLSHTIEQFETGVRVDPFDGRRGTRWIGDVYVWDGQSLTCWGARDAGGKIRAPDPHLLDLMTARLRLRLAAARPGDGSTIPFLTDVFRDQPIVLAIQAHGLGKKRAIIAAAQIDLEHLRKDFLAPHFAASGKLAVVDRSDIAATYWSTPLSESLPLLIVPSKAFVESQLRQANVRNIVFVGVGGLFLLVMILMVVKMMRAVQREIDLARLKSNFVADVSHELKTPLALIRMFSEMLAEDRVANDKKKQEYYGIINRESTRLTQLIENILDFSRIEAGGKVYQMRPIDIGRVVRDTYENYRADLDLRGFEHSLRIADDLPTVNADPDAMAQAMVNLMSNAVKYSHTDKRLDIAIDAETRRDRHGVLISVTDSGIGISPEDRAQLFDGFFRASDDRVRKVRGTGLGLSVVKHIIEAHDGSIDVESRLVKGTVFRVFLPETNSVADGDS